MESALDWIGQHPELALLFLFVSCAVEALFVIGIIIPGALILFGTGALVALGSLDFGACVLLAAAGAVAGDSITFWLGRHYGPSLFAIPLLARRPELLDRGQGFFRNHGGKSIVIGRMVGPLRPLMPAIAGAYAMRWPQFLIMDTLSALLWAVCYLAPGVVFGASLSLAAEVATHMVLLLSAVVVGVWLVIWLATRSVAFGQRHGERWIHRLLDWSHRHRRLGRLGSWMADPDQPEALGLLVLALIILCGAWVFLYSWWGLGAIYPAPYDAVSYQVLRDFYTPGAAFLASAVAMLGEAPVYGPVAVAVLASLLWRRRMRAAAHWVAAVAFAMLIGVGLYYLLPLPDPVDYFGGRQVQRFSGRDLILATVIYGFVPVLLSTRRKPGIRAAFYGTAAALVALIVACEVYLGLQWVSVAGFCVVLAVVWIGCLALGYRRHRAERVPARPFLWVVLAVFGAAAVASWHGQLDQRLERLQPVQVPVTTASSSWWQARYADLPSRRIGVAGRPEQTLNLQWQGGAESIRELLLRSGWREPVTLDWRQALRWLSSSAPFDSLPVMPQVHAGRYPDLVMIRPLGEDSLAVVRLWNSRWIVDRSPLWIGALGKLRPNTSLPLLRFPSAQPATIDSLQLLDPSAPVERRRVTHDSQAILLIRPASQ